ncbi:PKD domain-containing protein [Chitinophaga caseinilytica]|uniref:Uncharacterized protein n=1 Tax=Chitinophaga caseinilytica TaxID=2267521 RepID=A0ABZ2Z7P8_9BACT
MKIFALSIAWLLTSLVSLAQHVYPIKADSVRIYNTKDTAELILENHTQRVNGFLSNKGRGRTEFRRIQLASVGDTALALSDQDSLSIRDILWKGGLTHDLTITPDADYTIPRNVGIILLRNPTAGRKINLPPPAANLNREIVLLDKSTGNHRWTVNGAFVTREALGNPPYATQNNVVIGKGDRIHLFSDGSKWYDLSTCTPGSNLPPQANAGRDTSLPATVTQTTLNGTVTPGSSNTFTTTWRIISQPPGSSAQLADSTKASTTLTGLSGGVYVLVFTAKDHLGLTGTDTIRITMVNPSQMYSSGGYNDNVYDSATGRKTWIYLPDGYDPQRAEKYPMIIYLCGMGENGTDVNLILQPTAGLPKLLYDRAFPMESIVIIPQLTEGWWTTAIIKKAYNWAVQNYNVDLQRVYTTGLSTGGNGASMMAYDFPQLIAGFMPIASVESNVQQNGPVVKDIPAFFLNNINDPYIDEQLAFDCINSINSANPKGLYPPILKLVRTGDHGPTVWNNNVYDKRFAPFDFEQDFFLMHSKNPEYSATKYVERSEGSMDIVDYGRAKILLDKLPASAAKTALQQRLQNRLLALTENDRYFTIDPGVSANPALPNSNKVTSAAPGTITAGLTDIKGAASAIRFEVLSAADPVMVNDGLDHDYMGFDRSAYKDGINITGTGAQFRLHDLKPNASYDIYFFHSRKQRKNGPETPFRATANGESGLSGENAWNGLDYLAIANVVPDANGKIDLTLLPTNDTATVNVMMLKEKPGLQPGTKAKFNFCRTPVNLPGWTDVNGDPTANVQEFTDAATGWAVNTVSTSAWKRYFEIYAVDNEGMLTGTFGEFPVDVVRSNFINFQLKFTGNNYNLEVGRPGGQGLPAGNYRIKVMSSVRSEINNLNRGELNVKFGNGGNQLQYMYPKDNVNVSVVFTGYVQEGGTIKIGVHSYLNWSDFALINGLIVEKID